MTRWTASSDNPASQAPSTASRSTSPSQRYMPYGKGCSNGVSASPAPPTPSLICRASNTFSPRHASTSPTTSLAISDQRPDARSRVGAFVVDRAPMPLASVAPAVAATVAPGAAVRAGAAPFGANGANGGGTSGAADGGAGGRGSGGGGLGAAADG